MIPVLRLPPGDQWDQNMIDHLLDGTLYPHGLEFLRRPPEFWHMGEDTCVVLIPGRYWADRYDEVSDLIDPYDKVLAILTSDEENWFDPAQVDRPNIRWWVQTPSPTEPVDGPTRFEFGVGFPPHFNDLPPDPPTKDIGVFISAQNTHPRRREVFKVLRPHDGWVEETPGFAQGLQPLVYANLMMRAHVAPAPSGPVTADSFRAWEALEAHTCPILDNWNGYWDVLLGNDGPPRYDSPSFLRAHCKAVTQERSNEVVAWWIQYKRSLAHRLVYDLEQLGAI